MRAKIKSLGIGKWVASDFAKVGAVFDITFLDEEVIPPHGRAFCIEIDGHEEYCLEKGCAHLGGGDWEIIENDRKE